MKFMKNLKLAAVHSIRDENLPFLLAFMHFMDFMVRLAGGFRKRPWSSNGGNKSDLDWRALNLERRKAGNRKFQSFSRFPEF